MQVSALCVIFSLCLSAVAYLYGYSPEMVVLLYCAGMFGGVLWAWWCWPWEGPPFSKNSNTSKE